MATAAYIGQSVTRKISATWRTVLAGCQDVTKEKKMSEFLFDAEHEVGRNEVAIKLITGETLVGTMQIFGAGTLMLNVSAGQPYLIDAAKVVWVRMNK